MLCVCACVVRVCVLCCVCVWVPRATTSASPLNNNDERQLRAKTIMSNLLCGEERGVGVVVTRHLRPLSSLCYNGLCQWMRCMQAK